MSKGQFFEIDAIVALGLLIIGLIYVNNLNYPQSDSSQNQDLARDTVLLLRSLQVSNLDSDYQDYLESNFTEYVDGSFSIAQQIGILYLIGNKSAAANLSITVLDSIIPIAIGYGIYVRNSTDLALIYNRTEPRNNQDISVGRTLITGYNSPEQAQQENPYLLWPSTLEVHTWI